MSADGRKRFTALTVVALTAAWVLPVEAQQTESDRLAPHLDGLVTELRSRVSGMDDYEPLLVLNVLHDGGGYRVRASGRLERRLTEALARQKLRVVDQESRRELLSRLRECYTDSVRTAFCEPEQVIGNTHPAAGLIEGYVREAPRGTTLRLRLVTGRESGGYSIGEIVATAEMTIPAAALDPEEGLTPLRGTISIVPPVRGDTAADRPDGELRIAARTVTDVPAWVRVDGRGYGVAPVRAVVEPGRHLITVTAEGHQPRNQYVRVPPGGQVRRQFVLRRGVGAIRVRANAEQALALVNGRQIGRIPTEPARVPSGEHEVRVEREGFDPYQTRVEVEHGDTVTVKATLREHPGQVLVTCTNDSIAVYLDGKNRGTCTTARPTRLEKVAPGQHEVVGRRGGRRSARHRLEVQGDRVTTVELGLRERIGDAEQGETTQGEEQGETTGARDRLYGTVGLLQGQVDGRIVVGGESHQLDSRVPGLRLAVTGRNGGWVGSLGVDFLSLGDIGRYRGSNQAGQIFFRMARHFLQQVRVQPFLALQAQVGLVDLAEEEGQPGHDLRSTGVGLTAATGLEVWLSRSWALVLSGSYSANSYTGFRRGTGAFGDDERVGDIEGWTTKRASFALRFTL